MIAPGKDIDTTRLLLATSFNFVMIDAICSFLASVLLFVVVADNDEEEELTIQ